MAVALQRTLTVSLPAAEAAGVHHADMADREIEPHRVRRIELPQVRGDVGGHLPAGAGIAGEPQAPRQSNDVGIERYDQLSGADRSPDAEIHFVAPHHPAQEQVEALAGAACGRPRKEVADSRPL